MSLFGTSPPDEPVNPSMHSSFARSRHGLFDDEGGISRTNSDHLFDAEDDDGGDGDETEHGGNSNRNSRDGGSPWDMPSPRKKKTRAELLRSLLPASDVPESYMDAFDAAVSEDAGGNGKTVSSGGVARALAAAKLDADSQAAVMNVISPGGNSGSNETMALGRNEFSVLMALIGLAQEGEVVSLDGVDERRRNLPRPSLAGFVPEAPSSQTDSSPFRPTKKPAAPPPQSSYQPPPVFPQLKPASEARPPMDYASDDPWSTPDLHKDHNHADITPSGATTGQNDGATAGADTTTASSDANGLFATSPSDVLPIRTTSNFTTTPEATIEGGGSVDGSQPSAGSGSGLGASAGAGAGSRNSGSGWDMFNGSSPPVPGMGGLGGGFGDLPTPGRNGDSASARDPLASSRAIGNGRTGSAIEETVLVTLMPEKEGLFMFQHHNYEVTSSRRGSKVVRRYSDFVWLLECLHKRFPFRVLPLLPPKRVAVNGNHLSNDGAFIEKRRRGLARFLNALTRHPVLSSEQLVVMFLTVPTELSVWRKQATISVQDEFAGRPLPPGLEESLSPHLKDLFDQVRSGVRRSADLYITTCNIMDRLVKRSEGIANDHARMALSLQSLTEASADVYATDTNLVPLLNDGLVAMSKHLRTGQALMDDESRAWDAGVLEDLKRQRDALVGLRDLFDRRERLDKDNIPALERRIQKNEAKLATLRAKPEGLVKPGEIEKVVDSIIKDKESIVQQHNRSVFVKECLRDELVYFQATQYHVSRWNQDWAQERVKYAEMLADNWRRLLDELDGMPLGE
ncbi:Sorting nexin mvp1 [Sporothrix bragantina]|uniref:Sorting nexin MVP1 n=1 Tax=Sporothrix bragantina TaxID=671064 RepID=A0ABP0B439_9PEZI